MENNDFYLPQHADREKFIKDLTPPAPRWAKAVGFGLLTTLILLALSVTAVIFAGAIRLIVWLITGA
ncbi:hypothetical protein [Rothia dentocariosa]|uniref:hypothetical protein n=1 Tax=Rothia dentocariosa TaxID=2047 RepID=UPI0028E6E8EE|nr:hypothetical protein [Rothia dentocariosa]